MRGRPDLEKNMLRFALVGAGSIGKKHAWCIRSIEGASIEAVVDTDLEAPFAEYADLFVNADLNEIVPPLVEHLNAARREGGST